MQRPCLEYSVAQSDIVVPRSLAPGISAKDKGANIRVLPSLPFSCGREYRPSGDALIRLFSAVFWDQCSHTTNLFVLPLPCICLCSLSPCLREERLEQTLDFTQSNGSQPAGLDPWW